MKKIYDVTKELFKANTYPGDPVPMSKAVLRTSEGAVCNLTEITLGTHSGTHMDAPYHFVQNGKTIEQVELDKCIGTCQVVSMEGLIEGDTLSNVLSEHTKRILIKGAIELTLDAAKVLVEHNVVLLGVEGLSVGSEQSSPDIHRLLLGNEVVIVENLDLTAVPDGNYKLVALPMKLDGLDGAPCRVVLIDEGEV